MTRWTHWLAPAAALGGVAALAATVAFAQSGGAFDPAQLPAIQGRVAQYLPNPRGDVDGLLLDDGTQVRVPPHLSTQIVFAVHPGDSVTIHGLKARVLPVVDAASVTNDATHITVETQGGWHRHSGERLTVSGKIRAALYNPHGDMDGVLLDNGNVVHLPPPEADKLKAMLTTGASLVASGEGFQGPIGTSIGARRIGPDAEHQTEVAGPPMGMEHWMHAHWGHGPHGPGMEPPMGPDAAPPPPPPPPAR